MRELKTRRPIIYFPVKATPLQMEAGFNPLGKDLGGGVLDQFCFQKDQEFDRYIENKQCIETDRHWVTWQMNNQSLSDLHHSALKTIISLQEEALALAPPDQWTRFEKLLQSPKSLGTEDRCKDLGNELYQLLSLRVQEDITVLAHQPESALVMGHICTPSFWDPSHVKNASFWSIHHPVPGFPRDERVADRLSQHISQRGPLVRFVWTLSADDRLDHHPRQQRISWDAAHYIFYRVERQITIPLDGMGAIFLIRTYIHPLSRLSIEQRTTLRTAVEVMPKEISDYKGLTGLKSRLDLLQMMTTA